MRKKKIAIIGSESFLARNYLKYLEMNNIQYDIRLYDVVEKKSNNNKYTIIDFMDKKSIDSIDFNVDSILFFLGKTGTVAGFKDYSKFIIINEVVLLNFLDTYISKKCNANIIYPSTRLIFKSNEKDGINEDSEIELKSIYAVNKYAAEKYLEIYSRAFGIKYTILRICTPIGSLLEEDGNYGTFEIFKKQAIDKKNIMIFGDGKQKKTFTHIEDVCKAFNILVQAHNVKFKDYNLGGQCLSLLEIVDSIAKQYKADLNHIEWPTIDKSVDGGFTVFDSSRFDNEFGMNYKRLI